MTATPPESRSNRTTMLTVRSRRSVLEECQVEPVEALRVGDHIDPDDLAARDGKSHERDRLSANTRDHASGAAH